MPPVTTAIRCCAIGSSSSRKIQSTPSHHVHAAVHRDVGAGDVARFLGDEERHHRGDLLRLRQAAHRDRVDDLLAHVRADRAHQVGLDVAGRDRVDGNALAHHFLRQRLGEARHARLGGGVVGLAELALDGVHRGDVHHAPPAALDHAVDHLARDVEHAVEVGVDHRHPVLLGHALEHRVARDAGVVDQDVHRPDHRAHVVEHLGAGLEVRHVALGGVHAMALAPHRLQPLGLALVARQAAGDHRVAGRGEARADRRADAAHAARDEDDARQRGLRRACLAARLLEHRAHRSTASATPMPPPMHSDARPFFASRFAISCSSVTRMRQPEAPIGCPSAMAPPFTFTFEVSQPICRLTAIACAAKASLISISSRSFGSQPARARHLLEAGTGPMPMYFGSTPADAKALMRAMGFRPSSFALRALVTMTAAAPSLMPEALAAVTVPFLSKAGLRAFIASSVAPWRGYSSSANTTGPFFEGISKGMISSLKRPDFCAASVLFWLFTANSSCSSRVTTYSFATFSAVTPMWNWLKASHSPSTIIESISFASPMRKPSREPFITCGATLMFSWPPAITTSASPLATDCAASITAFRPEPHTLLMVMAGIMSGRPALIAAWRAGFWPTPAVSTCPRITSDTWSGLSPERSRSLRMMCAPRSAAGVRASVPPNLPMALRAAPAMTISSIAISLSRLACLLFDVAPGRGLDRRVPGVARVLRRLALAAAVPGEPCRPLRPPAAGLLRRLREPGVRVGGIRPAGPVAALALGRRVDHAGHVPGRAEREGLFAAQQLERAIRRAPRHDMVLARGDEEAGPLHLRQVHLHAEVGHAAGLAQAVLQVRVPQVPAVHRPGEVRTVGVPVEQVECRRLAAAQVVVDHVGPDEVVGA